MSQPTVYTGSAVSALNAGNIPGADTQPLSRLSLAIAIGGSLGPETPPMPVLYNTNSPGFQKRLTLAPGDNIFSISSEAPLAGTLVFELATGSTQVCLTKNVIGDSGEPFAGWVAKGLCYAPGTPPTQFIVNNPGSAIPNCTLWLI